MKTLTLTFILALSLCAEAPKPTPKADVVPEIDLATQADILSTQLAIKSTKIAGDEAVAKTRAQADVDLQHVQDAALDPLERARKICGEKFKTDWKITQRRVVCVPVDRELPPAQPGPAATPKKDEKKDEKK